MKLQTIMTALHLDELAGSRTLHAGSLFAGFLQQLMILAI